MLIARHAIAQPWQSHQFNQPQGDFDSIEGFAQTSTVFKGIVRSLKDEIFVVTMLDFPKARIHDAAARRVRCVAPQGSQNLMVLTQSWQVSADIVDEREISGA